MLLAIALIASFPVAGLKGAAQSGWLHVAFQCYLFAVTASYFCWFWHRGGQTLPMKTWGVRVVDTAGHALTIGRAFVRYLVSLLFFGPACAGLVLLFFPSRVHPALTMCAFIPLLATLWWARFDSDRQFLHDRLAGTRLIESLRK